MLFALVCLGACPQVVGARPSVAPPTPPASRLGAAETALCAGVDEERAVRRVRELVASREAQRLTLVRERPEDAPATMTARRGGPWLFVALEHPGDLEESSVICHLDGRAHHGGAVGRTHALVAQAHPEQRGGGIDGLDQLDADACVVGAGRAG